MKSTYKQIKDDLIKIIENVQIEDDYYESIIITKWDILVPDSISRISKPIHFKQGNLQINVTSYSWKNELLLRKNELIKIINENLKKSLIKNIIFN